MSSLVKAIQFKRHYVSLIEILLVSVLLIALTALLFPSLDKTLEMAKTNHCIANLRSIGYAMHLYASDYSKYVPFRKPNSSSTDPTTGHSVFWDDILGGGYDGRNLSVAAQDLGALRLSRNQLVGADIYNCPNDREGNLRDFETGYKWTTILQADGLGRSYSINGYRSWNAHPDNTKQGYSGIAYRSVTGRNRFIVWSQDVSRVINPSITLMVVERPGAGWIGGGGGAVSGDARSQEGFYDIRWWTNNRSVTPVFENLWYHQGGWNYLFGDGHAQNMLQEDTYGPGGTSVNPKGYWSINVTD